MDDPTTHESRSRPTLHLVLHPGFPKTATTWLQTGVLPAAPSILNLGKGSGTGRNDHADDVLHQLHIDVFASALDEPRGKQRLRNVSSALSTYSARLAAHIRESLANPIHTTWGVAVAVLSEERIFQSGGYELNAGLISALLNQLRSDLNDCAELNPHIVVTVREQKAWLKSYFTTFYDGRYLDHRSLRALVQENLENPLRNEFSQLHYFECVNFLRLAMGSTAIVRCVPMELLTHRGGSAFVDAIFSFLPEESPIRSELRRAGESMESTPVNYSPTVPHHKDQPVAEGSGTAEERSHVPRGFPIIARLVNRTARRVSLQYAESPTVRRLLRPFRKLLPRVYARFRQTRWNRRRPVRQRVIKLEPSLESAIDSVFAPSNQRLEEETGYPLQDWGYSCLSLSPRQTRS